MTFEQKGWVLDILENSRGGIIIWLIGEDGRRYRFLQHFPVSFYASGEKAQLKAMCGVLRRQEYKSVITETRRYDLFEQCHLPVLKVEMNNSFYLRSSFRQISKIFPELTYYDADVSLVLRHAAAFQTFPLAYCKITAGPDMKVGKIEVMEDPWEIKNIDIPLRIMKLEPDCNPEKGIPDALKISVNDEEHIFPLKRIRPLLYNLQNLMMAHDPDVILSRWGDTWLIPELRKFEKNWGIAIPWSREKERQPYYKPQRSYFSYGRIIFRGQQTLFFGRAHIDCKNAVLWNDYDLSGVIETARVTRQPLQQASRQSPGTGISSMQIFTALRNNILVPYQKQQPEKQKTAKQLLLADRGGIAYQPTIGVHADVGEIDFTSMYPSIMVRCNISPETHAVDLLEQPLEPPGLIPQTLAPLLIKRVNLKSKLLRLNDTDPQKKYYREQISAQKWLLVTCFGYLGYKNARFGRIESHETVTSMGREALFRAKEAAEFLGFDLLHMYVDGLWVQKSGLKRSCDYERLLDRILDQTGLAICLNGIYRWVAFLPSRNDSRVPVANRYFGVFQDGSIKTRGIEIRRRDTPLFIGKMQVELLEELSKAKKLVDVKDHIPAAIEILQKKMYRLSSREFTMDELWVTQNLSRELEAYRVLSSTARAALQMRSFGKDPQPGQKIEFLYTNNQPGILAREIPLKANPGQIDIKRYQTLLLRAATTVLQPFGWSEKDLRSLTSGIPAVQRSFWSNSFFPGYPKTL